MGIGPTFAEEHRNIKFNNNVTASLRQKEGMYYPLCGSSDNYTGNKLARIENRFDGLDMEEKTTRNGDTNNSDLNSLTRWIKPGPKANLAPLIDRDDMDFTEVELTSPATMEVAKAARKWHDDEFFQGYFGNAYTGELGQTAVPFKVANTIAHGGLSVTLPKLLAMMEMIATANVDVQEEEPILLLAPKDVTALMNIAEYKNADFNESRPLVRYELKPFMGFRFFRINPSVKAFKRSNSLLVNGTTRYLPCFVPSGLHRGVWTEFWGKIDERSDKQYSTQFYGEARSAVTRTDEDKCFIFESQS